VKTLLLITLFFITSLLGDKVLYLSYDEIPQRVLKGEIFKVTIKALSTVKGVEEFDYELIGGYGIKELDYEPLREKRGKYYYETFHFLATKSKIKLPDIIASLFTTQDYNKTTLIGSKLNVISLNPKNNFSNIIANTFELEEYKTSKYDSSHNIIVFSAKATNCNIKAMKFQNIDKQGKENIKESYDESTITYYAVINKELEKFSFSYFSLAQNKFLLIEIPVIVIDDSVVTQSDIKPKNQSHQKLKIQIASVLSFIAFLFILWRRKFIYLFFMLIPLIYIVYLSLPQKIVCIKKGSAIRLLPVENGTIFETTSSLYQLPKEGKVKGYVKVKLQNEKIGWVKNEDTCSR